MSFFYNIWVSHSSFFLVFLHRSQFSGYLSVLKQLLKVYIFTFFKSDIGNLFLKMCALKKKKPKKSALVSSLRNVNSAKEGKWELCFPKLIAVRNCQWTNGQSGWKTDRKWNWEDDQWEPVVRHTNRPSGNTPVVSASAAKWPCNSDGK